MELCTRFPLFTWTLETIIYRIHGFILVFIFEQVINWGHNLKATQGYTGKGSLPPVPLLSPRDISSDQSQTLTRACYPPQPLQWCYEELRVETVKESVVFQTHPLLWGQLCSGSIIWGRVSGRERSQSLWSCQAPRWAEDQGSSWRSHEEHSESTGCNAHWH